MLENTPHALSVAPTNVMRAGCRRVTSASQACNRRSRSTAEARNRSVGGHPRHRQGRISAAVFPGLAAPPPGLLCGRTGAAPRDRRDWARRSSETSATAPRPCRRPTAFGVRRRSSARAWTRGDAGSPGAGRAPRPAVLSPLRTRRCRYRNSRPETQGPWHNVR